MKLDLQTDPRAIIRQLWPEHAEHLSPDGNTMGGGKIDPDEGVVCNCGVVLGFPMVQDEDEYVAAEPEQPDTSGAQTGEPDGDHEPAGVETNIDGEPDEYPNRPDVDYGSTRVEPGRATGAWSGADEAQARVDYGAAEPMVVVGSDGEERVYGEPEQSKAVMPTRDRDVVPAEDPIAARVVTIDPTMPYGPLDVEHQLLDIAGRIERGVHFQRYWEERLFTAQNAYTQKSARERIKSHGGAKDVRDAEVAVACEDEMAELLLCESMVKAVKETMHNLRSLQSGYQTVARSVSESLRVPAGTRGRP